MIYLDNAATTYPKPNCVLSAMRESLWLYGANPGRAGHKMAYETAEKVFAVREAVSDLFGLHAPERVIFTKNCTEALNVVIKGLSKKGGHFICSDLEHNAVMRPLEALKLAGISEWSAAKTGATDEETVAAFEKLVRNNTTAFVCTAASNVFGKVLPVEKLAAVAHKNNIPIVVDAAQSAGVLPFDLQKSGIDFLCAPGHKGLYGPMGTGVLLCNSDLPLSTLIEGGTGNFSAQLTQPTAYPERLESGTLNVPGILGLGAGVRFIQRSGIEMVYEHEKRLIQKAYLALKNMPKILLYTDFKSEQERFVPLLSFNLKGVPSEETGRLLSQRGIAVRAGLHCAGAAHRTYHTLESGTVRICPSVFTKEKDVNSLLNSLIQIAKAV